MVEGAPLLRVYGSKAHRGFESLSLRQPILGLRVVRSEPERRGSATEQSMMFEVAAPVAQLDRAHGYEP